MKYKLLIGLLAICFITAVPVYASLESEFMNLIQQELGGLNLGGTKLFPGGGGSGTSTPPTADQILIGGDVAGVYDVKTLTAGTNITIATTTGLLTISATAGSGDAFAWTPTLTYGEIASATSSPMLFLDTVYASSTSIFDGLLTFGNATGSQLTLDSDSWFTGLATFANASTTEIHTVNELCFYDGTCQSTSNPLSDDVIFYFHNEQGDWGYELMLDTGTHGETEDTDSCAAESGAADGYCDLGGYITATSTINTVTWPEGTYHFDFFADVSAAAGTSYVVADIFSVTSAGVETLQFQATSSELTIDTAGYYEFVSTQSEITTSDPSDKMLVKLRGWTDSAAAKTITYYYEGEAHYSHFHTTFSNAIDLGNYTQSNIAETITSPWTFSGIPTTINYASTTALDSTTLAFSNGYLADYLYHTGDTDTYLRFNTNRLQINSGGTRTMDLVNGLVGIGTTTPYAKLSVVGETVSAYFTATTTATSTLPQLDTTDIQSVRGDFSKLTVGYASTTGADITTLFMSGDEITDFNGTNLNVTAGVLNVDDPFSITKLTSTFASTTAISATNIDLSGELRGASNRLIPDYSYPTFTYATSTAWTGTTTIPLGFAFIAETWSQVLCQTDAGTLNVSFGDASTTPNRMDLLNASTTPGTFNLSTNNAFTAKETRFVDIGTPATLPTKISCTIRKNY